MPNDRAQKTTSVRRPLSALLSQVLVAYTIELDNEFESRMAHAGLPGARLSLVVWTNLLRFIPVEDGITLRDLTARSLDSRESVKVQLGGLERWGFVALQPQGAGEVGPLSERDATPRMTPRLAVGRRDGWGSGRGIGTSWVVRLTPKGKAAADVWPPLWAEIEGRWKRRFGGEGAGLYGSLRDIAGRLEADLPLGLPAISDAVEGESYPPRCVIGEEEAGTVHLRLSALLSRVLLAFAVEFNRRSRAPLALCANVIRVLSEDRPVRIGELPRLTGASREASDIGWRLKPYVVVEDDPIGKRGKVVRLSPLGLRAQQGYYRLTGEIERDWGKRFGTEVSALRSALETIIAKQEDGRSTLGLGLVPPAGVARAGAVVPALGRRDVAAAARQRARDIVEQTERFLEDPQGSLPHYPLWDMNRGFGP